MCQCISGIRAIILETIDIKREVTSCTEVFGLQRCYTLYNISQVTYGEIENLVNTDFLVKFCKVLTGFLVSTLWLFKYIILLYLRLPKGGCCSILNDLSCSYKIW